MSLVRLRWLGDYFFGGAMTWGLLSPRARHRLVQLSRASWSLQRVPADDELSPYGLIRIGARGVTILPRGAAVVPIAFAAPEVIDD